MFGVRRVWSVALLVTLTAAPVGAQVVGASEISASQSRPARPDGWADVLVSEEVALGQDTWRKAKLAASSRHHEEVRIKGAGRSLAGFVVLPYGAAKAPVVVMIPEDQGLNNWSKLMADEIAAMGYIVVVPDLLSGMGPKGGNRTSFPDLRSIFLAHGAIPKTQEPLMTAELNAWADYGKALPRASGKLAVIGFAWGGGRGLYFAAQRDDLSAAIVFYDAAPPPARLEGLKSPLYGFYAEDDPRVTRSLEATASTMARLGKHYEAVTYRGTTHMFVRLGEEPRNRNAANIGARNASLARLQEILAKM